MNTYHIRVPFSGYSRGYHLLEIEAETPEEAMAEAENDLEYHRLHTHTVHDNTKTNFDDATLEMVQ